MPSRLYGDTSATLSGNQAGGSQILTASGLNTPEIGGYVYLFGDAQTMTGQSHGGWDVLLAANNQAPIVVISGDAWTMADNTVGGNDFILGSSFTRFGNNYLQGDAGYTMSGNAHGGNDIVVGGNGARTANFILAGDAGIMSDHAVGGNDAIFGGRDADNNLYGEADEMHGAVQGGDDLLYAGAGIGKNVLYGDARLLSADATSGIHCGNDLLVGSDAISTMYGDGRSASGVIECGNDRLVSGTGSEVMWGDIERRDPVTTVTSGADVFVFNSNNGQDVIEDFQSGQDHIDLRGFAASGLHGFAGLSWQVVGSETVISLSDGGHVTLAGVGGIAAGDFLFA